MIGIVDTLLDEVRQTFPPKIKYAYWGVIGMVSAFTGIYSIAKSKQDTGKNITNKETIAHSTFTLGLADLFWYPFKQIKKLILTGEKMIYPFPNPDHWYKEAFPQISLFGIHYGDPSPIAGIPIIHVLTTSVYATHLLTKHFIKD